MPASSVLLILGILAPTPLAFALEDGRIGVLYVGRIFPSNPFWEMRSDRLFSMSFVQATLRLDWAALGPIQAAAQESQVRRMVRLNMPRSYTDLVSRFDVVVFSNANRDAVGSVNIEMLARGVREGGRGLFMDGGWESFGGSFGPPWGATAIGQLLPTIDMLEGRSWLDSSGQSLVIDRRDNEFIGSLPWEGRKPTFMANFHHNVVGVKMGAEVLAHVESIMFKDHPAMITWELENRTRSFAYTSEICWQSMNDQWKYAIDFGGNLMIYLDGRPVPPDIGLVHAARTEMFQIATRRSLLMSLLEFCEAFGANTRKIVSRTVDIDAKIAAAEPEYLQLRFEEMLETYRQVETMLDKIEKDAVDLKNATLFWVYVVEWLAVTGTGLVCGYLLWSLMIRRSLYKETLVTGFRNT